MQQQLEQLAQAVHTLTHPPPLPAQAPTPNVSTVPLANSESRGRTRTLTHKEKRERTAFSASSEPPSVRRREQAATRTERTRAEQNSPSIQTVNRGTQRQDFSQENKKSERHILNMCSPFVKEILEERVPMPSKPPIMTAYEGVTDPSLATKSFRSKMLLTGITDARMCRAFPATLEGKAQDWFVDIPSSTITSFQILADRFLAYFTNYSKQKKTPSTLLHVKQRKGETLQAYLNHYIDETTNVADLLPRMAVTFLMEGLLDSPFRFSLTLDPPKTIPALMSHAQKYINSDEIYTGWEEETRRGPVDTLKGKTYQSVNRRPPDIRKERRSYRDDKGTNRNLETSTRPQRHMLQPREPTKEGKIVKYDHHTPLNQTRSHILMQIKEQKLLTWPEPARNTERQKNSKRYCQFHQSKGHDTEKCTHLMNAIEDVVRRGQLEQYINLEIQEEPEASQPEEEKREMVGFISGGPGCGGESSASRKSYARMVGTTQETETPRRRSRPAAPIIFYDNDVSKVRHPHDDALVIAIKVSSFQMKRVLIDSGSSVDILFWSAFERMRYDADDLLPVKSSLVGFSGGVIQPEGMISLPITVGNSPRSSTVTMKFLVRCRPQVIT
ncbi:hypothetical protein J5N97_003785 [Dioscorea zingiberensis]|uniref:Retrotransposon gag domain-containing protein n=1 Tax=Dioscorea zingiberensis TaxID=325984 RepID=A0A9D5HQS2_9LILI|nr:hypothetical protein J5N97_003785 [Dioscorea zingiberensis]